jgi:hypothetical protein
MLRIENEDLLKLVSYFSRANQFAYDGWLTQEEFDDVQDYIDEIKDRALALGGKDQPPE